ncbi:MAG: hypothetical protein KAS32_29365 [Candidatus Peribacteraceae bacterium]|nr:hypothetical protein [Candidatus Peribacteraceae bacterium]
MVGKYEYLNTYGLIFTFVITAIINIIAVLKFQNNFSLVYGIIAAIYQGYLIVSFRSGLKKRMIEQLIENLKDAGGDSNDKFPRPSGGTPYTM